MVLKHDVYVRNFQRLWSNHEIIETNKVEQQFEAWKTSRKSNNDKNTVCL